MLKEFVCGDLRYAFDESGFPATLDLGARFGNHNLLGSKPALVVTRADGVKLTPGNCGETTVTTRSNDTATVLEFQHLGMLDAQGRPSPGLRLTLKHEIHQDGTVFTEAFFTSAQDVQPPSLSCFDLVYPLDLSGFDAVRWGLAFRPKSVDGTLIQTSAPEREIMPGEDRLVEHGIFPLASFNLWQEHGASAYAEFFMEGDNVLAGGAGDNASSVRWENGSPKLTWRFLDHGAVPETGPWQWRNRWGWVVAAAARTRHQPPMAMYHYFDNVRRYPADEAMAGIAATGADVLILHENWRTDPQNGGQPYDRSRFRQLVDTAHRHGLRVMVYIRGNEASVVEDQMDWFEALLKRDHDGLYMDYGGPFHYVTAPDENFQGGRILFRRHYHLNLMRRRVVGPDGLLFSHTGPMFSALGMPCGVVDGYVSGEGERGLLIRSRLDHAYYSMSAVCPGTMWTAAFPEYGESGMVPFLAATGQSPHVPMGTQVETSSLSHPPAPGINDVPFRPLWKLWRLMRDARDLTVVNDYNSSGVFAVDQRVSHYLMAVDGRIVCIFANFTAGRLAVDPAIDFETAGVPISPNMPRRLCLPTEAAPGKAAPYAGGSFELGPHGVGAICLGDFDFAEYERPYPPMSPLGKAHLARVAEQRRLREGMGPAEDWWIRIGVPYEMIAYEPSMVVDLYDNRFELGEVRGGKHVVLGYIGLHGFQRKQTEPGDFILENQQSPWMSMRGILGPGSHHLAIRSLHRGDMYYVNTPFYSFIHVEVARSRDGKPYRVDFMNELEPDRSYLHFNLEIQK